MPVPHVKRTLTQLAVSMFSKKRHLELLALKKDMLSYLLYFITLTLSNVQIKLRLGHIYL